MLVGGIGVAEHGGDVAERGHQDRDFCSAHSACGSARVRTENCVGAGAFGVGLCDPTGDHRDDRLSPPTSESSRSEGDAGDDIAGPPLPRDGYGDGHRTRPSPVVLLDQRFATPAVGVGWTRSNRTLLSQPGRSLSTYSSPFTSAPNAVGWVGKVPISADS